MGGKVDGNRLRSIDLQQGRLRSIAINAGSSGTGRGQQEGSVLKPSPRRKHPLLAFELDHHVVDELPDFLREGEDHLRGVARSRLPRILLSLLILHTFPAFGKWAFYAVCTHPNRPSRGPRVDQWMSGMLVEPPKILGDGRAPVADEDRRG